MDAFKKIADRKHVSLLTLLCSSVYFVSYLTRINYNAVLVEILAAEGYTKAAASAALTGLFITYGAGQLISGYLGDRMPPGYLITGGLLVSAAMNLAIPFCPGTAAMTAVWCFNGFAQAMMWPPLVKIMAGMLREQDYKKACVKVSWGSSLGTIAVYLLAPLCISLSGWRTMFYFTAIAAVIMAFVWLRCSDTLERYALTHGRADDARISCAKASGAGRLGVSAVLMLALVMPAIVMQGILRDGITAWMPSYISETFDLGSGASILTGVALPVFGIVCIQLASFLNRKVIANEVACAAAIFLGGVVCCGALSLTGAVSPALSVLLLTGATGCMHGVNVMLICMLPPYFAKSGRISTISGALNFCTYAGSAVSIYGVALITEKAGWNATILVWTAVALAGTLLCVACVRGWNRFRAPQDSMDCRSLNTTGPSPVEYDI